MISVGGQLELSFVPFEELVDPKNSSDQSAIHRTGQRLLSTSKIPRNLRGGLEIGELQIVPVDNRRTRKQFINMLWDIYRDDPHWVPPLIINQEEMLLSPQSLLRPKSHSELHQLQRRCAVGRISAIVNVGHNERYDEKRGFFASLNPSTIQRYLGGSSTQLFSGSEAKA